MYEGVKISIFIYIFVPKEFPKKWRQNDLTLSPLSTIKIFNSSMLEDGTVKLRHAVQLVIN